MSKSKNFSIFYDSDETKDHTIDAEVLGQSLISFSKALKKADRIINGPDSTLEIDVKAHKEGSFGVTYEITQLLTNARDIVEFVGIAYAGKKIIGGSVMALIDSIGGRKIVGVVRKTGEKSEIELKDGTKIKCNREIEELVTDPGFREDYENVFFNPIKDDVTASVIIKDKTLKPITIITQSDASKYKAIASKTLETKVDEVVKNIRFTQINFDSGTKGWRAELPNIDKDVAIQIEDNKFLNSIDASEQPMVKGSLYEVKLLIKTFYKINSSPTYKYTIIKVLKNRTHNGLKLRS